MPEISARRTRGGNLPQVAKWTFCMDGCKVRYFRCQVLIGGRIFNNIMHEGIKNTRLCTRLCVRVKVKLEDACNVSCLCVETCARIKAIRIGATLLFNLFYLFLTCKKIPINLNILHNCVQCDHEVTWSCLSTNAFISNLLRYF